ncbi:Glutathione synthase/Ribosomal protein S6 modification enzyme (glutaminyl transferase) [Helicobacter fennelliae]|uniref:ATP-grasp domain-containing protein n=2 Tax=Helicobacter fennelliae TaxID=215 RepID=T1CYU3_9HELI|nr:hypothetical protein [Helicobacter fennelliae]GAD18126.1 hypothetical protein HFN_1724 [Helicobacter fennelliae MRY12-0050]SQB98069.1 Glutathione synthase/Ribosomal protein S6 modification enzyme (glutaminyl transferase) [Helicobacter fennelliae]STP06721.1 Glutathione synthase/Ribosomal protein S6 modification enzyme (glutaminyl transferase) [Helicobacter fennelliae]
MRYQCYSSLSEKADAHTDRVILKLNELKIPYFRLNLDLESLQNILITFKNNKWHIKTQDTSVQSDEISCVWLRKFFVELSLEEKEELQSINFKIWRNEFNATLLGLFVSLKPLPWLNPISDAIKSDNKYYQMALAQKLGLKMPKTIVSNEKHELIEFAKSCNDDIILKLFNQELYEKDKNGFMQGIYANRIHTRELEHFKLSGENPIVLQEYIAKAYEVRYTTIGKEHFICKIESQKSKIACEDWRRYDLAKTPHKRIQAPSEITSKVNELLKEMNLEYGALDFIVTPDDEWVFLEINCCGQWLWIEDLAGLDISGGIARWAKQHLG